MNEDKENSAPAPKSEQEKVRVDVLLVRRGLAESREKAQRLILAGRVHSPSFPRLKPGLSIPADTTLEIIEPERYVSRGGIKLEAALREFSCTVEGKVCVDIGASSGGFTDCLLQHGARLVYAVDVGKATLHPSILQNPRVRVLEHTNARYLAPDLFPEIPSFCTVDVSFISVLKILPALARCMGHEAEGIILIKPQFEALRAEATRTRGIIRDPAIHRRILDEILMTTPSLGWKVIGLIPSPIPGGSGNREYLAHITRCSEAQSAYPAIDVDAIVRNAFLIH